MTTGDAFVTRISDQPGDGPTLAVKDLIDVAGVPSGCGCPAVAERAVAAERDAACLAGYRRAGARIVGKTALNELAYGVNGENPWFGTPANPLAPGRMPGGSSSGSAVAVATGEAELALGTDTGGSIRIPAACCGIVGLKTTWGSLPLGGVRPLAPTFDTVGPMAADVAGVALALELLEAPDRVPGGVGDDLVVGRVRGISDVDEEIDRAVDAALRASGLELVDVTLDEWGAAFAAHRVVLAAEAWAANGELLDGEAAAGVSEEVTAKLLAGGTIGDRELEEALKMGARWSAELLDLLDRVHVLALPTIPCPPPLLSDPWARLVWLTAPINLAGLPALAMPVPARVAGELPASLQLVGRRRAERWLLTLGARVEAAVGRRADF